MDLIAKRQHYRIDGIFSSVEDTAGVQQFVTLEHAYAHTDGTYHPIVKPGIYTCQRGMHRLHNMVLPFETFEIMGVKGHGGILFHWGNWNDDSQGCALTGQSFEIMANPRHGMRLEKMVASSKTTFAKFMELQKDINQFQYTVVA